MHRTFFFCIFQKTLFASFLQPKKLHIIEDLLHAIQLLHFSVGTTHLSLLTAFRNTFYQIFYFFATIFYHFFSTILRSHRNDDFRRTMLAELILNYSSDTAFLVHCSSLFSSIKPANFLQNFKLITLLRSNDDESE